MFDFMKWYHLVLFVMFMAMVFSPVWFFGKLESLLNDDPQEDKWQYINHIDFTNELRSEPSEENMDKELHVLTNLDKMIASAKDKYAKTMWELKKMEYMREIRWRRMETNRG